MNKVKKTLLLVLCALVLVSVTVVGTLAYLTDSDSATNTFTVGNVQIDLNETDVDGDSNTKANAYHLIPGSTYIKDPTVTVKANSESAYVRMFVTVEDYMDFLNVALCLGEEYCGFKQVYAPWDGTYYNQPYVLLEKFTTGVSDKWECVNVEWKDTVTDRYGIYEFRYKTTTTKKDEDDQLAPLFTQIKAPGEMTNEMLKVLDAGFCVASYSPETGVIVAKETDDRDGNPFKITVRAEAIQASGFADADAAWAAFDAQNN